MDKERNILKNEARLREAIDKSSTIKEVFDHLGLSICGRNRTRLHEAATKYNLELPIANPHDNFKKISLPDDQVFCESSNYNSSSALKKRLIATGRELKCESCGLGTEWNGKPITLQLDHINGIGDDNRKENLRFLCPNCHSQTDTYAGKRLKKQYFCNCGESISRYSTNCKKCAVEARRNPNGYPPVAEIKEMLKSATYREIAEQHGVKTNTLICYVRRNSQSPELP